MAAGTDPQLVQQWITDVTAAKADAQERLRRLSSIRILAAEEITMLVDSIQDVRRALIEADLHRRRGGDPTVTSPGFERDGGPA